MQQKKALLLGKTMRFRGREDYQWRRQETGLIPLTVLSNKPLLKQRVLVRHREGHCQDTGLSQYC